MRYDELEMKLKANAKKLKESIDAPFNITEKINEMEMCSMKKKNVFSTCMKNTICTAAAIAAAFTLTFNCIPTLAFAVSDVPFLGDVVRIVTFGRFEVHENNYELDVTTPKIEGLLNKELEERLNKEFADNADEVIKAFENDIIDMSKEYGDNNFHLSVIADYEVKTDNENLLALDFYIINTQASAVTKHCYYNIDKKSGDLITLASLFKDNSDYVTPISNYISHEMKKQNADGTGSYFIDEECGFEQISEQQNFYINNQGNIVICFDEYEVASGVQGSPEFEIPENIVESILK